MPGRKVYRFGDLRRLVNPRSIAVVGASETPGAFGQRTLANLAKFQGKVFGVNPKYCTVEGFPCFPSLADLPEAPDCVILCVAGALVEASLEAAIAADAGGVIVYASGFAETGRAEAQVAQQRLAEIAQRGGVRLVGPNCVGLTNVASGAAMNFMPDCGRMIEGNLGKVGIVSQSGALGYTVLQGMMRGVGVSHYLAAGNAADVDVADFVAYLAEDEAARSIVCLFEGVKDGQRLLEAGRIAQAAGKPLIVYKAGNTEAAGKAALSHTGTLVGSVAAYRAAFEEVGAIQTDNLEDILELASFFAKARPPKRGRGIGIMATSGGAGVICADKAEQHGLALPPLAPQTRATLEEVVPDFGSVNNPADTTAEVLKSASTFVHCLDAFANDPSYSAVVVPLVFAHPYATGSRAPMLCEVAERSEAAIVAVWMNEWLEGPGSRVLDADPHVMLFRSPDRCHAALRAWFDWYARREAPAAAAQRLSAPGAAAEARAILAGACGKVLGEQESKRLLAAYGIPVPTDAVVATPEEAAIAAARIGFPVVVKVASPDILHKTEVEGIRLNLRDAEAVQEAAAAVLAAARRHRPEARIDGVSVQAMAPAGAELVLGLQMDRQFGPLVAVGSGGVLVELLQDVATGLAPLSPARARSMLQSLRGYKMLAGFRGQAPRDEAAAVDAVVRFSELAVDLADEIAEADVNPLIVGTRGAVAADALFVRA
jgi:acyl-CoA synthetase (NDP forming)